MGPCKPLTLVTVLEKLGREFLNDILRDGWIDIAGQCANTISVRNSGDCGM